MNTYMFRFRVSKRDPKVRELVVDADSVDDAFKKAAKRSKRFDTNQSNYDKTIVLHIPVYAHKNTSDDWKW